MSGEEGFRGEDGLHFVIYWRQADWGFYGRRNEAFARALAAHAAVRHVLHLETVSVKGVLAALLRGFGADSAGMRSAYRLQVRKAFRAVRVTDTLSVRSIVVLAFSERPWVRRINALLFRRQVRRARGDRPTVLLAYPPAYRLAELAAELKPDYLVADLVDDVPALETDPVARARRAREFVEILPRCVAAFATSSNLCERYGAHAPCGIEFLPNGVTVGSAAPGARRAGRQRPVVGYAGAINRTFDQGLVEYVVAANPGVDFLLIGPLEAAAEAFIRRLTAAHANCRYLGRRRHADLQRLLAGCDVLVNLKRVDDTTRGNDSIKIYEYLATGRPVVSTPMAPADRMGHLIHVAREREEFNRMLRCALDEDDPALADARRRAAAGNAWERRVERIVERVHQETGRPARPLSGVGCG